MPQPVADPQTQHRSTNRSTVVDQSLRSTTSATLAPKQTDQDRTVQQDRDGYQPASASISDQQQKTDWMAAVAAVPDLDSFMNLCNSQPALRQLAVTDDKFLNEIVETLYQHDSKSLIAAAFGMTDTLTNDADILAKVLCALDHKRAHDGREFIDTLAQVFKEAEIRPEDSARFALRVQDRVKIWQKESIGPDDKNQRLMNHATMCEFAALGDSKGLLAHFKDCEDRGVNLNVSESFFALGNPFIIAAASKNFEFIGDVGEHVLGKMMKEMEGRSRIAISLKSKSFKRHLDEARKCMLRVASTSEEMTRAFDCLQKVSIDKRKTIMHLIETEKENIQRLPQLLELFIRNDLRLRPADAPLPLDSDLPGLDSNPMSPETEPQRLAGSELEPAVAEPEPTNDELEHFQQFWRQIISWVSAKDGSRPLQERPMLEKFIDMGFVSVVEDRIMISALEPIPEWE